MNLKFTSGPISTTGSYVSNLIQRSYPALRASAIGLNSLFVLLSLSANVFSAESNPKAPSGLLLVCNKGDHTLGIIDPVAGRQIATIAEDGVTGHEVIASPDGKRAYVPIY